MPGRWISREAAMKHVGWLFVAALFLAQTAPARPAAPVEAVTAIVEAFRSHRVVAVMAGHGEARNAPRFHPHLRADAQAPAAGRPAFEIASVKPNTSRDGQPDGNLTPGGRFTFENATVRDLVALAYQLQDGSLRHESQISGGPSWISLDRFNIAAKAD
jgi:hypothetical protein